MKNWNLPTAQTILISIAFFTAVLTWIIPSGKFSRLAYSATEKTFHIQSDDYSSVIPATQESLDQLNIKIPIEKFTNGDIYKPISIPNTYKTVKSNPQGIIEFIQSPIKGLIAAADIIFLVLMIGGLIGVMNITGAFDSGIAWLALAIRGKEYILIIVTTILIAIGGSTFGLAEETIAFFPILIPVFVAARYDAMVGFACIFLGSTIGNLGSTSNPFSTIIASDAAGINWTTGLNERLIMLSISLILTIAYILWYAYKVKKDPSKSVLFNAQTGEYFNSNLNQSTEIKPLTGKLKLILAIFSSCFVIMIIGVSQFDWWFTEMMSTFLVGSVLIAIVARIGEVNYIQAFSKGASDLLSVSFIIGIARGVSILMEDGLISDTVLFHASEFTSGMHKGIFINSMYYIYSGLTFFIPSSSGSAVLTMPIMSPLADSVGIGREMIVNAYLYGMGLCNMINPTGLILASLAIVQIKFEAWLKFILPLVLIIALVTMVVLTTSVFM